MNALRAEAWLCGGVATVAEASEVWSGGDGGRYGSLELGEFDQEKLLHIADDTSHVLRRDACPLGMHRGVAYSGHDVDQRFLRA